MWECDVARAVTIGAAVVVVTDRFARRVGLTDDPFGARSPNHNNGPITNAATSGPRTKRLTRWKVCPLRRTNHSHEVIDGS